MKTVSELLEESIAHWKKNVEATNPEEASITSSSCALCEKFIRTTQDKRCEGCPVSEFTGLSGCSDTPYHKAMHSYNNWDRVNRNVLYFMATKENLQQKHEDWKEKASLELKFLESLRPLAKEMDTEGYQKKYLGK